MKKICAVAAAFLAATGLNAQVMCWNIENFFDTYNDPLTADDPFTPRGDYRWTRRKFEAKRNLIAKTIIASAESFGGELPCIVGLCEVENRYVLDNLLQSTPLAKCGYRALHREGRDPRGIDVALLYDGRRVRLLHSRFITIEQFATRDILYAEVVLLQRGAVLRDGEVLRDGVVLWDEEVLRRGAPEGARGGEDTAGGWVGFGGDDPVVDHRGVGCAGGAGDGCARERDDGCDEGCGDGCAGSCAGSCDEGCDEGCAGSCAGSCEEGCDEGRDGAELRTGVIDGGVVDAGAIDAGAGPVTAAAGPEATTAGSMVVHRGVDCAGERDDGCDEGCAGSCAGSCDEGCAEGRAGAELRTGVIDGGVVDAGAVDAGAGPVTAAAGPEATTAGSVVVHRGVDCAGGCPVVVSRNASEVRENSGGSSAAIGVAAGVKDLAEGGSVGDTVVGPRRGIGTGSDSVAGSHRGIGAGSDSVAGSRGRIETGDNVAVHCKGVGAGGDLGDTLHIFLNHWPSKYGGARESAPKRQTVADALAEALDSLFAACGSAAVLVMGDFNDTPDSPAVTGLCRRFQLTNLTADLPGSIKFHGAWEMIDQVLVSPAALPVARCARLYTPDFLLEEDKAYLGRKPRRTNIGPRYNGGASDHLPVLISFELGAENIKHY